MGKIILYFNEARDYGVWGWQCYQLDHMQKMCTSPCTDNLATPHHLISQARCSSWCPTNSVKALKAIWYCCRIRYRDSVDDTAEENSIIFVLIRMRWLPSARACGSKTLHQQNPPVLNWRCSVLWDLDHPTINALCATWRKGLRRVWVFHIVHIAACYLLWAVTYHCWMSCVVELPCLSKAV